MPGGIVENNIEAFSVALVSRLEHFYNYLLSLFNSAIILLLVPVLTYYFLRDEESFKRRLLYLFPPDYRRLIISAAEEINSDLGAFIRGSLLVSFVVALFAYAGLLFLGVKFPLVLAIVIGVTNLIPYIGPIIGALPACVLAFLDTPLLSFKGGFTDRHRPAGRKSADRPGDPRAQRPASSAGYYFRPVARG